MKEIFLSLVNLLEDVIAFVRDPDARKVSRFLFPNGNPMSIRDAKKKGLM